MERVQKAYFLNIFIAILEAVSVIWMSSGYVLPGTEVTAVLTASRLEMFKYFTVDSNIFMGIVAIIAAVNLKRLATGKITTMPKSIFVLMLMGTAAVTLTMMVTVFYLAPTFENGWFVCFNNSNFFLHLVNPLVSIIAFTQFEKSNKLKFVDTLWGILPMCLYAVFYVLNAAMHSQDGIVMKGYDFYGFFTFGLKSGFIVVPLIAAINYIFSVCLYKLHHTEVNFNENVTREIDMLDLLKAQQGELDAALMYKKIAEKFDDPEEKQIILDTGRDEGRHAVVFFQLTKTTLKPKKAKSIFVPLLISVLGKRKAFEIIAQQEYAAEIKYDSLAERFPVTVEVQNDEHVHGDRMIAISRKY